MLSKHIFSIKGWCKEVVYLHTNKESDAREWTHFWMVKWHMGGVEVGGGLQCKMLWSMMPTNVQPNILWHQIMAAWKLRLVEEFMFIPVFKKLLIFQQSKWDSLLYSVWCDSLAPLTHPETCWMQPPLFAVLPSSTAPSAVAKQPT